MRIKEVEQITGIKSKNIRFYEKEGLLSPGRAAGNSYRHYSQEDVRKLEEIKLLRKLGVSIADIREVQSGDIPLRECMEKYIDIFILQKKGLEKTIELCAEIQEKERCLTDMDVEHYIGKISEEERKGVKFIDIAKDFIMKMQPKFCFEPEQPIMNRFDFVKELEEYARRKGKALTVREMGMSPRILLDGRKYVCTLEMPRYLHFPFSIFFVTRTYGFRWVYLYEDYASVDSLG